MNRKRASELADVIKAYSEGATVQYCALGSNYWQDVEKPSFVAPGKYRVKIEPRLYFMNIYPSGSYAIYKSLKDAHYWCNDNKGGETITLQEIV